MELITEREYVVPLISDKELDKLREIIESSLKDKEKLIIQREIKRVKE